jgi:hypothetical protein
MPTFTDTNGSPVSPPPTGPAPTFTDTNGNPVPPPPTESRPASPNGGTATTTTTQTTTTTTATTTTTTTATTTTTTTAAPTTTTTTTAPQTTTTTTAQQQQQQSTAAPTTTKVETARAVRTVVTNFPSFDLQAFKNKFAGITGVKPENLQVLTEDDPAAGPNAKKLTIIIDSSNATANAVAQQIAMGLNATTQANLGISGSFAAATVPSSTAPAPAPEESNIPLIAGASAGGFVLLVIILFVAKKASSGGTGVSRVEDGPEGGMLGSYEQEMNRHNGPAL